MTQPPRFAAYIFDLDGTVYLDEQPIPGAPETIARLRDAGSQVAFVTNNPLKAPSDYAARLTRIGVPADPDEVTTSVDALVSYLQRHHPGRAVLAIAEGEVQRRLAASGSPVVADPEQAGVVVVSFDRTFSYEKLLAGFRAVRDHGAPIVATNPDPYCPTQNGGLPDCAAMLAALEACTGARAEAMVGKPSRHMLVPVLERLGVDAHDVAVIGDRPLTDVALAQAVGATGILVLSGATSATDAETAEIRPDYVLGSIRELLPDQRSRP